MEPDNKNKSSLDGKISPETLSRLQRRIMFTHRTRHQKMLKTLDLYYGQHMVVMELFIHGGSTQRDIAERLDISAAAVAMTLKKLIKNGLVFREAMPGDQRCNIVSLTEKGNSVAEICIEKFKETDKEMFKGFSDQEMEQLENYFMRMLDNIQNEEGEAL